MNKITKLRTLLKNYDFSTHPLCPLNQCWGQFPLGVDSNIDKGAGTGVPSTTFWECSSHCSSCHQFWTKSSILFIFGQFLARRWLKNSEFIKKLLFYVLWSKMAYNSVLLGYVRWKSVFEPSYSPLLPKSQKYQKNIIFWLLGWL